MKHKDGDLDLFVDRAAFNKIKNFPYKWVPFYNKNSNTYYGKATIYVSNNGKTGKGKSIYIHRLICGVTNPNDMVDHIDHNGLNDRMNNLRVTVNQKNLEHRKAKNTNNKSGYRNVFWNNRIQKWTVSLCNHYKRIHIGDYDNVDEANHFAEIARQKYYGEYSGKS